MFKFLKKLFKKSEPVETQNSSTFPSAESLRESIANVDTFYVEQEHIRSEEKKEATQKHNDNYRSDIALTSKNKKRDPRKPTEIFITGEARRLFSPSMLSKNQKQRTTGPKLKKLEERKLPILRTESDIANWLDIERKSLWFFATHRYDDRVSHYVQFAIPKRTGGERIIIAPKRHLKSLQRKVKTELVDKLTIHEAAHGFRKGRSIVSNAGAHVGKKVVVKFDLKDFFPSITFARLRGFLLSLGYDYVVATSIALLCTEANRQRVEVGEGDVRFVPIGHRYCVQGSPTSPGFCNAIARKLDARLTGYAKSKGWVYTRYADDMTFSSSTLNDVSTLMGVVRQVVQEEGFELNLKKTKVMRKGGSQRIAGVMVNDILSVPRKDRRKIRAMIHQMKCSKDDSKLPQIEGFIAFTKMVNKDQGNALEALLRRI